MTWPCASIRPGNNVAPPPSKRKSSCLGSLSFLVSSSVTLPSPPTSMALKRMTLPSWSSVMPFTFSTSPSANAGLAVASKKKARAVLSLLFPLVSSAVETRSGFAERIGKANEIGVFIILLAISSQSNWYPCDPRPYAAHRHKTGR